MILSAWTMQVSSSMTMIPAVPRKAPIARMESKSMLTSISSGVRMGNDEPPGMTAFSFFST